MAAIACGDLCFSYPNGVRALQAVNMSVKSGEFVSLIGPSGCGKSTLLRVVADLLAPESGVVTIAGQAPGHTRQERRIAMVFQEPALLGWRRAARNVELPLELAGKHDVSARTRARQLLALVGLSEVAERLPAHMSGGQRQRVAIARALIQDPAVLLMDEPFGSLDQITRDEMNDELLKVWENTRITVLFVTHSISEAVYLSDRVAVFTPRPGTLRSIIDIPLARPRLRAVRRDPAFFALENQVLAALEGREDGRRDRAAGGKR
jgi:NitT/TauT family transport system ATP-binding protein